VASVCIHRGEEPVISGEQGICNIFFTNCNLQCIYCQNSQISDRRMSRVNTAMELPDILDAVKRILDQGITLVGFVSPSHFIPQMLAIIHGVREMGYNPTWVYNTNGYDKAETLRSLEGTIDIYLPDFKYMDSTVAGELSDAADYPQVAMKALKEMFRQKGSTLILGDAGTARSGLIIRHLVLPGMVENSLKVLRFIAEELSPRVHLSLMSQYYPTEHVRNHRLLGRGITEAEYDLVQAEMEHLGMYNGWVQEFESSDHYRPDFRNEHPFEAS